MKGGISVNPIFKSYSINKPHVYCKNPLIVWDTHRLYFNNHDRFIRWQNKGIINATYSKQYKVILLMCDDSRLVTKIDWESKYSVGYELIQQLGLFIMIGVGQVQILRMQILSNIKNTKFLSSMKFKINKIDHLICDSKSKLNWNKGYGYNIQDSILYVWSLQDINFYSLNKLEIKSQIRNLTKKQNPITTVYYNLSYKYTITGMINGNIKVWRLPIHNSESKTENHQYILINTYQHHIKSVQSIIKGSDDRIIMSSSIDMCVCLWSLETFELLRIYNFLGEYTQIMLRNYESAYAIRDSSLGLLTFGKNMQFISEINSEIIYFHKHHLKSHLEQYSQMNSLQLTLGSNIGFQISLQCFKNKDLNKTQLQYIYPPLKAKGIKQILSCPYVNNRYYLLVQTGQLFRLRIQGNSGKIQKSYHIQKVQDKQQYPLNQIPTIIKFLKVVPPVFDSEIIQNNQKKKQKPNNKNLQQSYQANKLITIGCNKGTIIFINTDNFQKIYTRITYHRQAILQIQSIYKKQLQTTYVISLCQQYSFKVIKLDYYNQMANCIITINCNSKIEFLRGFNQKLAVVLDKGIFEIFELDQMQNQFYTLKNLESANHDDNILVIDHEPKYQLILTGGNDNIKIWTQYKILLYEIYLDQGLKLAIWCQNLEILISHNLKILFLKDIGLQLKQGQIFEINQSFLLNNDLQKITLHQFLQQKQQNIEFLKAKLISKSKNKKVMSLNQKGIQKTPPKMNSVKLNKIEVRKEIKEKSPEKKRKKISKSTYTVQEEKKLISQTDLDAMSKHIEQLRNIKKQVNASILPRIPGRGQDNLFDNFMRDKLIKKKVLTRRDITLNRIIMKNIVKDHFGNDQDILSNLKLDF